MSGYGYQPAPQKSGSSVGTCMVVGLLLGGLGMICCACMGVGAIYYWSTDSESVSNRRPTPLSADERAIQDALRDRDRARVEKTTPPANRAEALRDVRVGSDARREIGARWLSIQTDTSRNRSEVASALEMGLRKCTSEDSRFTVLRALQVWGSADNADVIAETMRFNRIENAFVDLALEILEGYRRPSTIDDICAMLSSAEHGRRAVETLKAFGPTSISTILEELDLGSETCMTNARLLFTEMGQDVDQQLLELCLTKLDAADARTQGQIADELSKLEVVPSKQDEVSDALDPMISATNPYIEKVIRACKVWATEKNAGKLIALAQESRFQRNEDLIQVIVGFESEQSIGLLASLLDDSGSIGRLATDALEEFGDPCKQEVLKYYNSTSERERDRARQILDECDVTNEELVSQCVDDLETDDEDRHSIAMETLKEAELVENQRSKISKRLIEIATDDDVFNRRRQPAVEALERWATLDQATEIAALVNHRDQGVWLPAFRLLIRLGAYQQVAFETAEKLGSFTDRQRVADAMIEIGPAAEPLAIGMLSHTDKSAVEMMCKVLAEIGGQNSLDPLKEIAEYAVKHNAREITFAANLARESIRERQRREPDDENGDDADDGQSENQ